MGKKAIYNFNLFFFHISKLSVFLGRCPMVFCIDCFAQPRSQGSLLPAPMGAGRREPWERGCVLQTMYIRNKPFTLSAIYRNVSDNGTEISYFQGMKFELDLFREKCLSPINLRPRPQCPRPVLWVLCNVTPGAWKTERPLEIKRWHRMGVTKQTKHRNTNVFSFIC